MVTCTELGFLRRLKWPSYFFFIRYFILLLGTKKYDIYMIYHIYIYNIYLLLCRSRRSTRSRNKGRATLCSATSRVRWNWYRVPCTIRRPGAGRRPMAKSRPAFRWLYLPTPAYTRGAARVTVIPAVGAVILNLFGAVPMPPRRDNQEIMALRWYFSIISPTKNGTEEPPTYSESTHFLTHGGSAQKKKKKNKKK